MPTKPDFWIFARSLRKNAPKKIRQKYPRKIEIELLYDTTKYLSLYET